MPRSIAIIGGGIIGTCTAYYLSLHPKINGATIRIFEGSSIAAGASGKAGGFLAKDWHGGPTASLGELSFQLHEDLAKEHDGEKKWGYRKVTTVELEVDATRRTKHVPGAEWLSSVSRSQIIGHPRTTAQVHPGEFTRTIAGLAQEQGVEIVIANVEELTEESTESYIITTVNEAGEKSTFTATDVVFAAGPWTGKLAVKLLKSKAGPAATIVPSECSTSVILRPPPNKPITAHALFTNLRLANKKEASPEIYPRADGSVYVCGSGRVEVEGGGWELGLASDIRPSRTLPEFARDVKPDPQHARNLCNMAAFVSPSHLASDGVSVEVTQACFRPDSSRTGAPIIGQFGRGLWLASGHQVWGISNGPGTGKIMAELILEGSAISANVKQLVPNTVVTN